MAQRSSRKSKSFLNNPVVLILIVLALLVGAASSLGFLDQLIAMLPGQAPVQPASPPPAQAASAQPPSTNGAQPAAPAPVPASAETQSSGSQKAPPGIQPTPAQTSVKPPATRPEAPKSQTGGSQPSASASTKAQPGVQTSGKSVASSGKTPASPQGKQAALTAQPPAPVTQSQKVPKEEQPKKKKLEVPAFSFKVGRDNPFLSIGGSRPKPATTTTQPTQPTPRPSQTATPPNTAQKDSPKPAAKPEGPRSWRYTGYSANGRYRFAVIETPTNAYIVSTGDRIEGIWLVTEVTGDHVTIKNAEQTIVLPLGGDGK